ncbi:MAG: hypothetical protein RIR70_1204 [Pseudomonadota bacterium]
MPSFIRRGGSRTSPQRPTNNTNMMSPSAIGHRPPTFTTQILPQPPQAPLRLEENRPETIATALMGILHQSNLHPDACDLALAKCCQARDYNTACADANVRNVMRMGGALDAGLLGEGSEPSRQGLEKLIEGRHYLAIAHGEGAQARITLLINQRHEYFPKVLLWQPGRVMSELRAVPMHGVFESRDDRIILGPHMFYSHRTLRAGPMYQEVQSGLDCGLHAINALCGKQRISKAQFQAGLLQTIRAGASKLPQPQPVGKVLPIPSGGIAFYWQAD